MRKQWLKNVITSYSIHYTKLYEFSFVRWKGEERLLVVANFDPAGHFGFELQIPEEIMSEWGVGPGPENYTLKDQLSDTALELHVESTGTAWVLV